MTRKRGVLLAAALALCAPPLSSRAGEPAPVETDAAAAAPVVVDGRTLFKLKGVAGMPARRRAEGVGRRIREAAQDEATTLESVQAEEAESYVEIRAGERVILLVFDGDAAGTNRSLVAEHYRHAIVRAIDDYRKERRPRALLRAALRAGLIALLTIGLMLVARRGFRRLEEAVGSFLDKGLSVLESRSLRVIQARPLKAGILAALRGLRVLMFFTLGAAGLHVALGVFPWTRRFAREALHLLAESLRGAAVDVAAVMPKLAILAVLIVLTRYALKLTRLLFSGVERGDISIAGFDRDWALPTYKIVRLLLLAFTAVVAYPYVPGANSEAFKGVTLFLGLVFSLGSSSVVANIIAGYSMTYRRAFKVGDRVLIGDVYGDVAESGLMVTRVRTPKNEDVVIPNSVILGGNVVNYSVRARGEGLILHTPVGVGYDAPWRKVEALLLLAAERTPGLLKQPAPFVLQRELGTFAVIYEINAHTERPEDSIRIYTALHQNILDLFNEHGVQIMTPAYEGDPQTPKMVPKERWHYSPSDGSALLKSKKF